MAKYLVTYHGMGHPDPATMEAAREAFKAWVASSGGAVVDPGSPVNLVGQVSSGSPEPVADYSGYTVIEADSDDAAKALLESHPFVARGGTLQVSRCL